MSALYLHSLIPLLLLAIPSQTLAQTYNVLDGAPSCAQSCSALTAAQSSCNNLYPNGPWDSVATCFCTNPQISTFGSNPEGICTDCTGSDATGAGQWFAGYCAQPATITGIQTAAPTTATTGSTAATTTQAQASATNSDGVYVPVVPQTYWEAHGKWIIMVIVLIVGFAIIIGVGVFFKKRHNKKRNGVAQLPLGSGWGPTHPSHPNLPSHAMDSNTTLERRSAYGMDSEKNVALAGVQRAPNDMNLSGKEGYSANRNSTGGNRLKKHAVER